MTTLTKIKSFIKEAQEKKETIYFDVDGTLISERSQQLTPLGEWAVSSKIELDILTFGGWNKDMLRSFGLNIKSICVFGDALQNGKADFDGETYSKKVKYLIDNERHSLTEKVLLVNYTN